ncbi:DNA internalization-related competence protein ComEC/Rec2 [Salirhabdus salicampi]|uniref:DNA internalization-related competence protein ComEC/Rec2 n=1 Tax=Salirhabdus salicampi TaxID=476102 RepID=UPI0020C34784|nr:DNA internalization-related competence protein ComEC/Rec2 [Salirhabdus salicampi]
MKGKWHYIVIVAFFAYWNVNSLFWLGTSIFGIVLLTGLYSNRVSSLFLFVCTLSFVFFSYYAPAIATNKPVIAGDVIKGIVVSTVKESHHSFLFTIKEKVSNEHVIVYVPKPTQRRGMFQHGAQCTVKGTYEKPTRARNPGNFDYRQYLKKEGISYVMRVQNDDDIVCTGQSRVASILTVREWIMASLEAKLTVDSFAWVNALIFGEDENVSDDIILTFRQWGLSHLLAISGLHVGLITYTTYLFFTRFCLVSKESTSIILIIFLPFYAILAGADPPVLRATIMTVTFLFGNLMNKKWLTSDIVSFAAIVMILSDKYAPYSLSFQFSFLVTFTLLLSKTLFLKSPFWNVLNISFICYFAVIPLQLNVFYFLQPLSLFANLLIVPYFSFFVIPATLLSVLLALFPLHPISEALLSIHHFMITEVALPVLQQVDFTWVIGQISPVSMIFYYCTFVTFMRNWEREKRRSTFLFGVVIVLILIIEALQPYFDRHGYVTMLDVGQGDTIVIELPYRKSVMLIDTANTTPSEQPYGTGEQVIQPFLWSRGIQKVDHVIITHFDEDHVGSLPFILRQFKVENVYTHPTVPEQWEKVLMNVNHEKVKANMDLVVEDIRFEILHPNDDESYEENDRSVVISALLGGQTFLLTGDIGFTVEEELMERYPSLTVDVLKVAHHGSKYSTSEKWIKQVNPKVALISVGRGNRYGHPSEEVLARLKNAGVEVFRTDENGAIMYKFTEKEGTFYPFYP